MKSLILSYLITTLNSFNDNNDWVSIAERYIDNILLGIKALLKHALISILDLALDLARIAYIAMAVIGLIMWASGFSTYSGRKLIMGSLILAILVEIVNSFMGL